MSSVSKDKGRRSVQKSGVSQEEKLCGKQACKIQWCLAKRGHKEHLCQPYIDEWKLCCEKVRAAAAAEGYSGDGT